MRIATGQIDPSSRDALATQSRLSAEVAQINTQEANLEKQLKLLSAERDKLQLHSPIDGVVVAREVKQQLAERPVARGDALMTIVDLNGPWQLRIDVADRDSGYVQKYYAANGQVSGEVDFVFDSLPEKNLLRLFDRWLSLFRIDMAKAAIWKSRRCRPRSGRTITDGSRSPCLFSMRTTAFVVRLVPTAHRGRSAQVLVLESSH